MCHKLVMHEKTLVLIRSPTCPMCRVGPSSLLALPFQLLGLKGHLERFHMSKMSFANKVAAVSELVGHL